MFLLPEIYDMLTKKIYAKTFKNLKLWQIAHASGAEVFAALSRFGRY